MGMRYDKLITKLLIFLYRKVVAYNIIWGGHKNIIAMISVFLPSIVKSRENGRGRGYIFF